MNASNTNALPNTADEIERLVSDCPRAWRTFHAQYANVVTVAIRRVAGRFGRVLSSDASEEIYAAFWLELLRRDKHKLRSFDPERGIALTHTGTASPLGDRLRLANLFGEQAVFLLRKE